MSATTTHTCNLCAAQYERLTELNNHLRQTHQGRASVHVRVGTDVAGQQLTNAAQSHMHATLRSSGLPTRPADESLESLRQELDRVKGEYNALLAERAAEKTAHEGVEDVLSHFSDDELTAMGLTREQALERIQQAASRRKVAVPITAEGVSGVVMDSLSANAFNAAWPNRDAVRGLRARVTAVDEFSSQMSFVRDGKRIQ